ncbi:MAG: PEP-CTERM sorting domain-containing protein [Planctomycetota bacterium]|jgi:hypothetical protein
MRSDRFSFGEVMFAVSGILLMPSLALGGTIPIATGPNSSVDGYLRIGPDDYGSWVSTTFGGAGDLFNPLGGFGPQEAAFTSGFFLFVPNRSQRELLSDTSDWQNVFGADASLDRAIISPLVASDTNGDGVSDTLDSSFRVIGASTDLRFDLTQRVRTFGPGVSFVQQDYTITNVSNAAIDFAMVRAFDGDLLWSAGFENDEVGTTMHGAGLGPYVFEQEVSDPGVTAITLSSLDGGDYYGGKNGIIPGGSGTPYGFGTDVQVWDNFGVPSNWRNHIAGVGYNINGVSGEFPPGSTSPEDGFIGLDFSVSLASNASSVISVFHTYGQNSPIPAPGTLALLGLGALVGSRRRRT